MSGYSVAGVMTRATLRVNVSLKQEWAVSAEEGGGGGGDDRLPGWLAHVLLHLFDSGFAINLMGSSSSLLASLSSSDCSSASCPAFGLERRRSAWKTA